MIPSNSAYCNDTQVDPENPERPFSQRQLVECMRVGAERFGWNARNPQPGKMRDGRWLVGLGMAAAFRNNLLMKSGARVRLGPSRIVTVETDMTDIGTGSYTIIAQTAAEMMGVPLERLPFISAILRFLCPRDQADNLARITRPWRLCGVRQASRGGRPETRVQFGEMSSSPMGRSSSGNRMRHWLRPLQTANWSRKT